MVSITLPYVFAFLGLRLLVLLLMVEVIVATLPGVKRWDGVMIWEMSASVSVWSMYDQYVAFRSYALTKLSDMGYFDYLLEAMSGSLRVIQGIGATTGIVCALHATSVRRSTRLSAPSSTPGDDAGSEDK